MVLLFPFFFPFTIYRSHGFPHNFLLFDRFRAWWDELTFWILRKLYWRCVQRMFKAKRTTDSKSEQKNTHHKIIYGKTYFPNGKLKWNETKIELHGKYVWIVYIYTHSHSLLFCDIHLNINDESVKRGLRDRNTYRVFHFYLNRKMSI